MIPTLYYVLRHYHSLSPGPPEEYFNHRSQIYVMFFQLLFVFNHKNWIPVVLWRKKLQYVIGPLFFSTHVQPRGHFDLRHVTLYTRNGQEESNSVSLARTRKSVPKEKESGTLVYTWCYSGTPQKKKRTFLGFLSFVLSRCLDILASLDLCADIGWFEIYNKCMDGLARCVALGLHNGDKLLVYGNY